jgi:hypothetical protein
LHGNAEPVGGAPALGAGSFSLYDARERTKIEWPMPFPCLREVIRLATFALILSGSPAVADPIRPQCWDCLQRLALQLPEVNPQEDAQYEQGLPPGSVLPALSSCSFDDSETPTMRQIIDVFTDAQVQGSGAAYVQKRLEQMPQVSADDRAKLVDGARQDLDTTLRHLVDHNCAFCCSRTSARAQAVPGC